MKTSPPASLLFLGASMLLLGVACGGLFGEDDGCKKDTDCKGERVCAQGKCSAPTTSRQAPAKASGGVYSFKCINGDFYEVSDAQLRRYRNEIYARHGRQFKSKDLRRYFNAQSWYRPNPNFSEGDLSPTDNRCLRRIRQVEKNREHGDVACPFVYLVEEGEEVFQGEILRYLNTPKKAGWQSLRLYLEGTTPRIVRVRLAEEKAETTFLDAVVLQVGDRMIQPKACSRRQAHFCKEDGQHRRLLPGEALDLVFEVGPGAKGPLHLWATGYYRPH